MKNECYIVRDLLPSYIDQLCSEETSKFVKQHIDSCEHCAHLANQMLVEFDIQEQPEIPARLEQKEPFQRIASFFKAQKNYTAFLSASFWVSFIVTIGFTIYSLTVLIDLNHEREEAQVIEQQKSDIVDRAFAAIVSQETIDEPALQAVFQEYSEQLQLLAVFSIEDIDVEEIQYLQEGPKNFFPIDYSQAELVIGEKGKLTGPIIPNDYDLGTVEMAKNEWIVQFEYKESFHETLEYAHQIKYYSPSNWAVFQIPILLLIVTIFILGNLLYEKRITKPVKNILN